MQAKLVFNLPEDEYEYKLANNAQSMYSVLWEMSQWLRAKVKYAPDDIDHAAYKAYEDCKDQLMYLLQEENVVLK